MTSRKLSFLKWKATSDVRLLGSKASFHRKRKWQCQNEECHSCSTSHSNQCFVRSRHDSFTNIYQNNVRMCIQMTDEDELLVFFSAMKSIPNGLRNWRERKQTRSTTMSCRSTLAERKWRSILKWKTSRMFKIVSASLERSESKTIDHLHFSQWWRLSIRYFNTPSARWISNWTIKTVAYPLIRKPFHVFDGNQRMIIRDEELFRINITHWRDKHIDQKRKTQKENKRDT